jgi:hypothetical protein
MIYIRMIFGRFFEDLDVCIVKLAKKVLTSALVHPPVFG